RYEVHYGWVLVLFFQAEDGVRDFHVTGVQMCALPICRGADELVDRVLPADDRPRDVRQYTIEEFLGTTTILGASFSPDGSKILVSSDETGVFNAFAVPVDRGEPVQLTHSATDAVIVASYFPKDERFLYLS